MAQVNYSDDADYSQAREGFILNSPVQPSLIHFFDQGLGEGARNLAMIDATPSTIVGAPVEMSGFVRLGSQSQAGADKYVQTQVADGDAMTVLLVVKCPDTFANGDHIPSVFGNFAFGDDYEGVSLVMDTDAATSLYVEYQDGAASPVVTLTVSGQDNSDWAALGFTITPGVGISLFNFTTVAGDGAQNTALPRRISPRPLRIGAAPNGFAGLSDVAFAAVVPTALSRSQCQTALAPVRAYFAEKFGIVT